ncbi:helix-turn-helix transcriptional regulator [Streptomyces sp. NPDC001815]|uniref:helix-turn-helix domain-containing protein n=1 Tax=Streptomyces sp. NPDC001815 TaxID=3154526 RepID=UPI0033335012
MGRPESPVDYTVLEVGILAAYLRGLREVVGKTYDELAESTFCSASSLKRAARGGASAPSWAAVSQYVTAAGGDLDEAQAFHTTAEEAAVEARRNARRSSVVPKPQFVRDVADLSGALRDAYNRAGRPSVREMEEKAGWRLPHSTAHEIVRGRALPFDVRTYIAFLEACEIQDEDLYPWFECWLKVRGGRLAALMENLLNIGSFSALRPSEKLFVDWYTTTKKPDETVVKPSVVVAFPERPAVVANWRHRWNLFADMTLDEVMGLAAQRAGEEEGVEVAA